MRGRTKDLSVLSLIGLDLFATVLSYELTVQIRVMLNELFSSQFTKEASYLLMPPLLFILPLMLFAFFTVGLYTTPARQSHIEIIGRVTRGVTLGVMLIIVGSFFLSRNLYSRSLIFNLWIVNISIVAALRALVFKSIANLRQRGFFIENVAIFGNGERVGRVAERLRFPGSDFNVAGLIQTTGSDTSITANGLPSLGVVNELERVINEHRLDRILLSDETLTESEITEVARVCERMGVQFDKTADLFGGIPKRIWVVNGLPLVSIVSNEFSRWDHIGKRLLDISLSLLLIILLLPFYLLTALAIRIESPGPIFFKQIRRGKGGRYFVMLKFRSMKEGAEEDRQKLAELNESDGALFKMSDDPRVTRTGRVLRKLSMDELPQLINVLLGDMSFVGPRPLPVSDIETKLDNSKFQYWIEKRESVLPGITGLWQVRGRSQLGFKEMLTLDMYYIKNWSLMLDILILFRTVPVVLLGKGAY